MPDIDPVSDRTDVAPDGSPLGFYRRLPAMGEPELIHSLVPAGASILDLGCGPGRIAGPLARLGHPVTGVDNGAAMIRALPANVEGIVGDAATIRLGRRFDAVLMASHLVDDPDAGPAFARTAAAHVARDGVVIGESYPREWDPEAGVGSTSRLGDAEITLLWVRRDGDLITSEVRYGVDGNFWTQAFTARLLDESALRALLDEAGLVLGGWLGRSGWFVAGPR
jgi:SAM-dependent methyltransferase